MSPSHKLPAKCKYWIYLELRNSADCLRVFICCRRNVATHCSAAESQRRIETISLNGVIISSAGQITIVLVQYFHLISTIFQKHVYNDNDYIIIDIIIEMANLKGSFRSGHHYLQGDKQQTCFSSVLGRCIVVVHKDWSGPAVCTFLVLKHEGL